MTTVATPTMKQSTMTLNKDRQSFFIDTPLGSIEVSLKKSDHRKLVVTHPAFFDIRRAGRKNRVMKKFFQADGSQPKWSLLSPVTNGEGELIGVTSPNQFSLDLLSENSDER